MTDWIKDTIKEMPLDDISEKLNGIVAWWSETVEGIPASELPFNVYVGGSIIVCILWYFVARMLSKPFGGMSWIMVIAVLLTPGPSLGETGEIAPAIVGVVYSILMKDFPGATGKFIPIIMVMIGGFLLGFIWQLIREQVALFEAKQIRDAKTADGLSSVATTSYPYSSAPVHISADEVNIKKSGKPKSLKDMINRNANDFRDAFKENFKK